MNEKEITVVQLIEDLREFPPEAVLVLQRSDQDYIMPFGGVACGTWDGETFIEEDRAKITVGKPAVCLY